MDLGHNIAPRTSTHKFSQVPKAEIPRSSFDRSCGHKTTFDAGYLVPIFVDEALPGDTFNVNMTALARLATPIFPIMDNMYMDTQFFSVPIRLLWDNWQRFNGEQRNPGDSTDFEIPQMTSPDGGYQIGSLHDYFGLPTGVSDMAHSSLWHRAYNLIYNEWFRDQNMQNSVDTPVDDGPDDPANFVLLRRGKRHDYFTSCLPWPQKGASVQIPLGTKATVHSGNYGVNGGGFSFPMGGDTSGYTPTGAIGDYAFGDDPTYGPGVWADLSTATAATINSLRQAFQIQKIFERDARGGTRYTELIRAHFGVVSPDARLQRPEYLGGGSTMVNISPIPNTTSVDPGQVNPLGSLAGVGTAHLNQHGFTASFTEHCLILGFVSVRADLTYQQGLNRMWSRKTRFDFYLPALAHIGEQAVLQKEIFATGVPAADDTVFGYQERFAEYRYKPSQVTGLFRSSAAQPLDAWHLAQDFATAPVLDDTFIVENPPLDRCIAVTTEPHFLFDSHFNIRCARPMPLYGVPGLIDHF